MAKNSFFDKDRGWDKLVTSFKTNEGESAVFIGFLRSSGLYKPKTKKGKSEKTASPTTIAQIAAINELGTADGRIPERSFMRSTINQQGKKIEKMVKSLANQILDGDMTTKKALGLVGIFVQQAMKRKVVEGVPPANAPETIERKKSSHTLIDTGQLLNSIDFEVKSGSTKR